MEETDKDYNEEKKKIFEAYLTEQQKFREHKLSLKKKEDEEKKNPEEHMLYIQKEFKAKSQLLQAAIKKYKAKQETFEVLMGQYSSLKEYYVGVCYALKTYDRQAYKQTLDKMYNTIMDLKKKHEPRQKFRFKRRDQDFGVQAAAEEQVKVIKETKEHFIPGIKNKSNETVIVKEGWSNLGSYKIVECQNAKIELHDKTQILFLKKLHNCTIKTALTKSTVFVDQCNNCTLQINCHQLRIHNSFDTTFRIFVTSKAIIEDCDRVKFTPYTFAYDGKQSDEREFDRINKPNLWREIQDFNWLKDNIKSPHYELIEP